MVNGYIDFHVHPIEKLISPIELIAEMDRSNVEKAVLLALDISKDMLREKKIEKKFRQKLIDSMIWDIESTYQLALNILDVGRTENEYVAALSKRYPDKFIGFGSINPRYGKKYVKKMFEKILDLELKGIKIIPTLQFFDPSKSSGLEVLWKYAQDEDLIIIYHTGCDPGPWEFMGLCKVGQPSKILKYIKSYETKVVLAHAGAYSSNKPGIWIGEALSLANKYEHVWLDVAAVPDILHDEKTVELIKEFGLIDKILFGSDYPVIQGLDMYRTVKIIELSPLLSDKEKIKILRDNALKILQNHI